MNRRNKFENDIALFQRLREKGYALGTDFIVGHPGESEALWQEALHNLQRLPLTHVHAFTYSKRDGTPSAAMRGEVNGAVAKARLKELTSIVDANNLAFRKEFSHLPLDVLIESEKEGRYHGLDQFFNKVVIESPNDLVGNWLNVESYRVEKDANYVRF